MGKFNLTREGRGKIYPPSVFSQLNPYLIKDMNNEWTTEVAVISLAGTVYSRSVRVAGDKMDESILQHIKRKYNLLIGLQTAELIKVHVGNAYPTNEPECIDVKGRDLVTGIPKILTIDSEEIRDAISE